MTVDIGLHGDVILNGEAYRVDLTTYQRRDIIDFAPRGAQPSGASIAYSELQLYQILSQLDWRHGFGHHRYDDASGYMHSVGDIDARHAGLVMRSAQANQSDTDNNRKDGIENFTGNVHSWGPAGVRQFTTGWTGVYSTAVNWLLSNGAYIFALPDGGRIIKSSDGSSWSNAGLNSTASSFQVMTIHGGYVWAAEDGNHFLHYASKDDLSDLEGGGEADTNVVKVGPKGDKIVYIISFGTALYAARPDGLWVISQDNNFLARKVLDFSNQRHSNNFRSMAVFEGQLYFPIRHRLYRWSGSSLADVTPRRINDSFPFVEYGDFKNLVARGRWLYCTARTNETTYTESILAFDGAGHWFQLHHPITDGVGTISMLGFDPDNNRLWYHLDLTADETRYISVDPLSEYPIADFTTAGNHDIFLSIQDMGFRRVTKSTPRIEVEGENLNSTQTIGLATRLDGGSWVHRSTVSSSGLASITFNTTTTTIEYKDLELRLRLATADSAQSPVLRAVHTKFLLRPDVGYGYQFDVIAQSGIEYGEWLDERTASQIVADLETARASKAPLLFTNLLGDDKYVQVSAVNEVAVERFDDEADDAWIEHRIRVSLVEVTAS